MQTLAIYKSRHGSFGACKPIYQQYLSFFVLFIDKTHLASLLLMSLMFGYVEIVGHVSFFLRYDHYVVFIGTRWFDFILTQQTHISLFRPLVNCSNLTRSVFCKNSCHVAFIHLLLANGKTKEKCVLDVHIKQTQLNFWFILDILAIVLDVSIYHIAPTHSNSC